MDVECRVDLEGRNQAVKNEVTEGEKMEGSCSTAPFLTAVRSRGSGGKAGMVWLKREGDL